jgi:hypothetical protein
MVRDDPGDQWPRGSRTILTISKPPLCPTLPSCSGGLWHRGKATSLHWPGPRVVQKERRSLAQNPSWGQEFSSSQVGSTPSFCSWHGLPNPHLALHRIFPRPHLFSTFLTVEIPTHLSLFDSVLQAILLMGPCPNFSSFSWLLHPRAG